MKVAKIAAGAEVERSVSKYYTAPSTAGKLGGKARARNLSAERRSEIARRGNVTKQKGEEEYKMKKSLNLNKELLFVFMFEDPMDDKGWTACAMNMGLIAYGDTEEKAQHNIEELMQEHIKFAFANDIADRLYAPTEDEYIRALFNELKKGSKEARGTFSLLPKGGSSRPKQSQPSWALNSGPEYLHLVA